MRTPRIKKKRPPTPFRRVKRQKRKVAKKPVEKPVLYKIGDKIGIWFDGEWCDGTITDIKDDMVCVHNDDLGYYNPGRDDLPIDVWVEKNSNYIMKIDSCSIQ